MRLKRIMSACQACMWRACRCARSLRKESSISHLIPKMRRKMRRRHMNRRQIRKMLIISTLNRFLKANLHHQWNLQLVGLKVSKRKRQKCTKLKRLSRIQLIKIVTLQTIIPKVKRFKRCFSSGAKATTPANFLTRSTVAISTILERKAYTLKTTFPPPKTKLSASPKQPSNWSTLWPNCQKIWRQVQAVTTRTNAAWEWSQHKIKFQPTTRCRKCIVLKIYHY